jgi:hypothetical protein
MKLKINNVRLSLLHDTPLEKAVCKKLGVPKDCVGEIKIVRTKRFGMKPMFPEDACIQMELLGHNFFVFSNAETDEVNVVYKRKDNTYGLIEPEF